MITLTNTVRGISRKISQMDFCQNVNSNGFNKFSKHKKARYISAMEKTFFSHGLFFSIFQSLEYTLLKIESVKKWRSNRDITKPIDSEKSRKRNMELVLAWENIYFLLSKLYFNIRDNGLIDESDLKNKYPELNYSRLLRNDFVQHPDLFFSFYKNGRSFIYPGNQDLLPYEQISPTGDGLVVYFQYFQKKVTSSRFLGLSDKKKKMKNKEDYIKEGGWKPYLPKKGKKKHTRKKSALTHRIKGFGLPSLDQKKLAGELNSLFDEIIFPHLTAKKDQAQRWNLR